MRTDGAPTTMHAQRHRNHPEAGIDKNRCSLADRGYTAPEEDYERQDLWRMEMSVEDVRVKFHIKNITNIIGEPTYKAINELREALYLNVAAIPTTLERGRRTRWTNHGCNSVCER